MGEGGWGEPEYKYQNTIVGVGSSQIEGNCANQVAPSLKKSNPEYQIDTLGENPKVFVYDGVAPKYGCTQHVATMHQGGTGDTAEMTVQNSCNGCLAGKTD